MARPVCVGFIHARLVPTRGWYPGAVADAHARLAGVLFELHKPQLLLPHLDRYEDHRPYHPHHGTFRRQCLPVTCADGIRSAWVYLFNHRPYRGSA